MRLSPAVRCLRRSQQVSTRLRTGEHTCERLRKIGANPTQLAQKLAQIGARQHPGSRRDHSCSADEHGADLLVDAAQVEWERSELTPLITEHSVQLFAVLSYLGATAAKFEIFADKGGKYHFHLKAPDGEIIAASQGHETKASAEKGIEAIKTHAPNAHVEDHTEAKST